jgi:hypothetical protein
VRVSQGETEAGNRTQSWATKPSHIAPSPGGQRTRPESGWREEGDFSSPVDRTGTSWESGGKRRNQELSELAL